MKSTESALAEFANDAFYLAFNTGHLEQMTALWSEQHPVVCIHPGWPPLFGRETVLDSWRAIFEGRKADEQLICHEPRVYNQGDIFSVICYEQLPSGWLVATNNFVMERGEARIVHHQAGPCAEPPEDLQPQPKPQ